MLLCLTSCVDWSREPRTVAIGYPALGSRHEDSLLILGMRMAAEALNAETGGNRYRFVVREPGRSTNDPVQAVAQLRDDPEVVGAVGNIWSQELLDAAGEYSAADRKRLPALAAIAPLASNRDISGISPWIFRLPPTDSAEAVAAANFALDSLHARRAAVFFLNDAFGRDWSRAFRQAFVARGGTVIVREPYMDSPRAWADYAQSLSADVLVIPAILDPQVNLLIELHRRGDSTPVLSGDSGWDLVGSGVARILPPTYYAAIMPPPEESNRASLRKFVEEFRKRGSEEVRYQSAAFAYDATLLIGRAVLQVGPDRKRVRDFIESLGRSRPSIEGVTGPLAFDASRDRPDGYLRIARVLP